MASKKNEIATKATNQGEVVAFDPTKYKVGARVVVPTISLKKMKEGDALYFKAEGEVIDRQATDDDGEPKMENGKPVMMATLVITNLETGEYGQIVLGAIPARGLKECAPITGRMFAMQKGETSAGKATKWSVVEMIEG